MYTINKITIDVPKTPNNPIKTTNPIVPPISKMMKVNFIAMTVMESPTLTKVNVRPLIKLSMDVPITKILKLAMNVNRTMN